MEGVTRISQRAARGSVLARLRSLRPALPAAQQVLADCVLSRAADVPFLAVRDLAVAAGVSVASISRFARRLGYESFKQFKLSLGKESRAGFDGICEAIAPGDTHRQIIEKVFRANMRSLEETLGILDGSALARVARWVAGAGRVVFFGIGSSGNIAQDAALRLVHLDVPAEAYFDSYQMVCQSLRMKPRDVAFGISHSGRSAITVRVLQLSRRNGARTVGLSNYLQSPLHDASDAFLCTSFSESRVKAAALSSRIAQMCIIDALYLLVARRRSVRAGHAERLDRQTEGMLRLGGGVVSATGQSGRRRYGGSCSADGARARSRTRKGNS